MNLNVFDKSVRLTLIKEIAAPLQGRYQTTLKQCSMILLLILSVLMSSVILAAAPASNTGKSRSYKIGPEDVLQISVWKEPELQREVLVRPDGGITFPLAGDIIAAGKEPIELQAEIKKRIQKYIPDAVVTVSVIKLTGFRIYIIGKVKSPGQFVIGRYVDVLQALTLAGGVTPYAAQSDIKVLRKKNGKEKVFLFDYNEVKNGENLKQNISLQNDDVVVVP